MFLELTSKNATPSFTSRKLATRNSSPVAKSQVARRLFRALWRCWNHRRGVDQWATGAYKETPTRREQFLAACCRAADARAQTAGQSCYSCMMSSMTSRRDLRCRTTRWKTGTFRLGERCALLSQFAGRSRHGTAAVYMGGDTVRLCRL